MSIIIPVFNSENFLDRCLKSVFTAVAFAPKVKTEVILVDNGSSDGSLEIARKFAEESPLRVSVLQCHTPGAAAVRNFGADKARGKYIWFVDADDTITQDAVKFLVEEAEGTGAELTMLGAERIYPDGHTDYLSAILEKDPDWKSRFVRYGAGPWQFLILRSWWVAHKFKFREGIIHEDMELISSLILYLDKFASVDEALYLYYQNEESVLHKKTWDPHYLDIFPALSGLRYRFLEKNALFMYHDELEWFFIWNLLIDSAKDFAKFREGRVGFKKSREMLREYYPEWRKNKFLHQKPLKLRLRVYFNYFRNF